MDDLIVEFIAETNESLAVIDMDLLNLEQNPNDTELLSNIFRLMHTIKGTCGFLGLSRLEKVAHHAENVLGRFRDGDLEVTQDYVTLIFESIDRIKMIVGEIETTGAEPDGDDSELIKTLDEVYEGKDQAPQEEPSQTEDTDKIEAELMEAAPKEDAYEGGLSQEELDALEAAFNSVEYEGPLDTAEEVTQEENVTIEAVEEVASPAPKSPQKAPENTAAQPSSAPKTVQSLRVNVDVLEDLMTMVSELVLTRNQLLQIQRHNKDGQFDSSLQNLNHVVSELQEGVMKTRMQPIGNAWSKLPRIIRDLCLDLGKKIDLVMTGQDTELDRQVLDLIKDPLTHMVRNSADHGVEMPNDRLAAGKQEKGTINLNAFHEGGHIIIEIKDDGKGLNTERIRQKVLENGLASEEELNTLTTSQIHQFVFHAGFSTAEKVTSVSGRGVGMDVVRTNIEKIGGTIDLHSEEGKGSTFSIKIPLTLAIVSALIVESAEERFAIPQLSVQELVMASDKGENRIEHIKGAPVFRLRDHLLPLIHLDDLLKIKKADHSTEDAIDLEKIDQNENQNQDQNRDQSTKRKLHSSRNKHIVVTKAGSYTFGIIVDQVHDTEEIVVKPVASILKDIEIFSGNTILGDGTVIMILDPAGIARTTGEISVSDAKAADRIAADDSHYRGEKTSLLLFRTNNTTPKAVPLSLVSRLEDIDTSRIEIANGKQLIQYRGELIPLIKFDDSVETKEDGMQPTLIFSDGRRTMGLMIDEIIDIIEEHINIQINSSNPQLLGSAIIKEKATDIIDVGHFLNQAFPDWFKNHGDNAFDESDDEHTKRVLLIDDSPFFRNMLTPLLSVAGYSVTTAESPMEALKLHEQGNKYDIIISDIEMPEMSGFEFAEKIRNEGLWEGTPLIALSSHATPKDIERGQAVGFNEYVAKFDRDTLLNTLSQTLSEKGERA